jgi:hypothetical protein
VDDRDQSARLVDALVEQARALTDEDRRRLAAARQTIDESFHAGAWRAAFEMLPMRAAAYADAWQRIGPAFVPDRLGELVQLGDHADPDEVRQWQEVARLAHLCIDDEVLALLTSDSIPPPHVRELHLPWRLMLESAHVSMEQ